MKDPTMQIKARMGISADGLDEQELVNEEGELLRHLTLDPERDYQPLGAGT
jgi:hypothetical protein